MVGGFFAGQLLIPIPVVGGLIGTVVGGFAGGLTGAKLSIKFYERLETRMELKRLEAAEAAQEAKKKAEEEKERQLLKSNDQGTLTYEGSLELLGVTEEDSFATIYNKYMLLTNNLQAVLAREACEGADNLKTK